MKLHVFNTADAKSENQLKEFFDYLNNQKQKPFTLPSFNKDAE